MSWIKLQAIKTSRYINMTNNLCVIFDLDGTLVDSERLCNQALIDLLPFINNSVESLVRRYRGGKLATILADIETRFDKRIPSDFEVVYRRHVDVLFQSHLKPIKGVPEMLKNLHYPSCIGSSGPIAKIRRALAVTGLAHYFGDRLFSSYNVGCWKPNPGLFLYAASQMGFSPEQCIVIEDSDFGIEAARLAGMYALKYSGQEENQIRGSIFSDMQLLPELLDHISIDRALATPLLNG